MKKIIGSAIICVPFIATFSLVAILDGWLFASLLVGTIMLFMICIAAGIKLLTDL